jgi:hypothetical protein
MAVFTGLGSAASPSITFSADTNTGIFSPGADQVAIATNGVQRLTASTTAITSTLPVLHPLGAVGTPSITFTGDLNTGFWSPTADTLAASTTGAERLRITSAGNVGIGTPAPIGLFHAQTPTDRNNQGAIVGRNSLYIDSNEDVHAGTVRTSGSNGWADSPYFYVSGVGWGVSSGARPLGLRIKSLGGAYSSGTGSTTGVSTAFEQASAGTGFGGGEPVWTERLRIDPVGRLLVGTSINSTGGRLQVNGKITGTLINSAQETFNTTSTDAVVLTNTIATGTGVIVYVFSASSSSVAQTPGAYLIWREITGVGVSTLVAHQSLTSFTCDGSTGEITITPNTTNNRLWRFAFVRTY